MRRPKGGPGEGEGERTAIGGGMQSTTPPAAEGGNVGEAGSQEACSDGWGVVRFGLSCVSAITSVAGSLTWMAAAVIPGQDRADTTTTSHAISHRPISTPHDTYNTSTAHRACLPHYGFTKGHAPRRPQYVDSIPSPIQPREVSMDCNYLSASRVPSISRPSIVRILCRTSR
jgi:hypothetical protein